MSRGGVIPYQLRPNKAVERLMFVDLLQRLDPYLKFEQTYQYISFGGPQMEDFRLMHELFREMKMISIEKDAEVIKRQKFNGPHTNITYRHQASSALVTSLSKSKRFIVWLDYTEPSERHTQIAEFKQLVRSRRESCIVKITLNAAASTLGGDPQVGRLQPQRLTNFLKNFKDLFEDEELTEDAVTTEQFPATLLKAVGISASEALKDRSPWVFQPLTSAVYADGQTMLTVTGLVAPRSLVESTLVASGMATWDFARLTCENPVEIEVPDLTLKERIFIDQLLPKHRDDVEIVHRKLGCCVDTTRAKSERQLRNYVTFRMHYPHFVKVTL